MNHPEKMPHSRYIRKPIAKAEIARQSMELEDEGRRAGKLGQKAYEMSAGEERVLLDILSKKSSRRDKQD